MRALIVLCHPALAFDMSSQAEEEDIEAARKAQRTTTDRKGRVVTMSKKQAAREDALEARLRD